MLLLPALIGFAASFVGALVLVPVARQLAHRIGWVDAPDGNRKVHPEPVPNVGGLGIIGGALLGLGAVMVLGALDWIDLEGLVPSTRWLIGGLLIAAVGFIDDRVDLNHWTRLLAQLGVTALVFSDGARITLLDGVLGDGMLALTASFLLTAIWMVGMMNAVNLIDGLDGLAAGSVAIALIGLAGVHALSGAMPVFLLMAVLVGALVGFLRYNCCPASIFMGDSGSLFLGFSLAACGLYGSAHVDPVLNLVIPAVVMGLPVLDTLVSILRRLLTRRPLFAPDKDHIHHRLANQMSPARAVRVLWGLSLFLALGGLAMAALPTWAAVLVFVIGVGVVYDLLWRVNYLPSPALIAIRIRRRRKISQARSERLRRVSAGAAPDLPPRAGRAGSRVQSVSGPDR